VQVGAGLEQFVAPTFGGLRFAANMLLGEFVPHTECRRNVLECTRSLSLKPRNICLRKVFVRHHTIKAIVSKDRSDKKSKLINSLQRDFFNCVWEHNG
jgi:hypothetical protein